VPATGTRSRVAAAHLKDALLQAWKTLSGAIVDFSGLDLDGADLVNRTFRSFDLTSWTAANRNRHEAYVELTRGLARRRNVVAYPGAVPLSDLEAAAFTLVAGTSLEWVTSLERPEPATNES
jgi:hypothetical protein